MRGPEMGAMQRRSVHILVPAGSPLQALHARV